MASGRCHFRFFYGIGGSNYFDRDLGAFNRSLAMAIYLIIIASLMILTLIVYPLQRLTPIAYTPQLADLLFYTFTALAVLLAALFFIPGGVAHGLPRSMAAVTLAMPLIMLHAMLMSGYTTTLNLTAASLLEGGGNIDAAKRWYAKAAPYIDHDPLLAALNHRQGVLNVLDGNYEAAITAFKKVISDYSEDFAVYAKARRYVESYRKNQTLPVRGRKILSVRHRTFEQAASCFPNSLAVILSFYEKQATPTRALSYAIKEGFDKGTFIWKADTFLNRRGYQLITTFWQTRQTLIRLLEAGYPVLIYIPGHVYTLYGYDAKMDIFFCYNTAKLNRWDDAPFFDFQQEWLRNGFLMSVVVKSGDVEKVRTVAPALFDHQRAYQDYQKTVLNRYYASRKNYWPDGNRQHAAEAAGLDALVFNDDIFHENGFSSLPWHPEAWDQTVAPLLNQPWSTSWGVTERQVVYLLFHHQPERARQLLQHYQHHIEEENFWIHDRLVRMRLATALQAGDPAEVRSIADNLIGIANNDDGGSYWGYYFKAVGLVDAGDPARAAQLLLPLLNKSTLEFSGAEADFWHIVRLLADIQARDPALIPADKAKVLDLYRIRLAMDP
ncbi:hypothetical protein [Desulfosarcina cetonica]|uniref:hypothetical protein n=1 Tax=Desulfosarcina cetonica TaxID=90730 RepID=UPI001FED97D3|nr:hypothetical protein [Desulfosarcina cetonica]